MSYLKYDGTAATLTSSPVSNLYGTAAGGETLTATKVPTGLFAQGDGDRLVGGGAGDTFYLQGSDVRVEEPANPSAPAKIVAWQNVWLGDYANVHNVEVGGANTYAAGNSLDNVVSVTGSNQELYGGAGQDVLIGNGQGDTFVIVKGEGNDAIYNFNTASDVVRLNAGFKSFAEVQSHMTQSGADVNIDMGGGDAVVLRNVNASQLTASNFQLGLDTSKLGAATFNENFDSLNLWNGSQGTWSTTFWYHSPTGAGGTLDSNGEQQWYINANYAGTSSVKPWTVANGELTLTAAPATADISAQINGYKYTSGEVNTFPSFAQQYGYFEMRADIADNAGGWPAFWLMPTDGSWPPELDVMETLTKDPHADWTTVHTAETGGHTQAQSTAFIPDTASGYHTYGVLWTATDLTWYVDGAEVFKTATPADMHKPMYMMANLALGGWGGNVDAAALPAQFKIDYIRAYGLADGSSKVTLDTAKTGGGSAPSDPPSTTPETPEPPPATPSDAVELTAKTAGSTLVGGAGADTLNASEGLDTLTGGAGADHFVIGTEPWAPIHVSDFKVGEDTLDLSALLKASGYSGSDAIADHYVYLESDGAGGTLVRFDRDGEGSAQQWPNSIVDLEHVSPTGLTWSDLSGATTPSTPSTPSTPVPAVGQDLVAAGPGATLTGGTGADTLHASEGLDTLTGGQGADHFVFGKEPWAPVHVADFQLGQDKLDLSALFKAAGYSGTDPVADHYVYFESDSAGGTLVRFDRDGTGSVQQWPNTIIDLEHVSPTGLTWEQLQGAPEGVELTSADPGAKLVGGDGADTLHASQGLDTLTGGAGADHFALGQEPWAPIHVTDFKVGEDVLDFSALFKAAGYTGSNPVADHYVYFESDGAGGTLVRFDRDGAAGGQQWPNTIVDLEHVSPTGLSWDQLQGGWIVQ